LIILIVGGVLAFNLFRPITVLPRINMAPGFSFVSETGEMVTSDDLRGSFTFYTFTYTHCADACGQTAEQIAAFHDALTELAPADLPVRLVTISLDPQRDDAAALAALAERVRPPTGLPWTFLVGGPLDTRYAVGGGFDMWYAAQDEESVDYRVAFDPRVYLVDQLGVLRAEYLTATPDLAIVARDLDLLASEAANSDGVARYGYEAAHLFVCYPR
jgi:protein SCO1/2